MSRSIGCLIVAGCLAATGTTALAGATLGSPFGDGMVLQRDMAVPIWGWAAPDEKVTVEFKGQKKEAVADKDGKWRVTLDPLKADANPATLSVHSSLATGHLTLSNVLVGEVWACSGQSNMAMRLGAVKDAQSHIEKADLPLLRVLGLPVQGAGLARDRVDKPVRWVTSSPQTAGGFSAVAFYFGRDLLSKLEVPVGLIVVTTGATPIELWVPRQGLALTPELAELSAEAEKADADYREAEARHRQAKAAWENAGKAGAPPAEPVHPYLVKDNERRGLGTLFNGSVAPVAEFGLRGMIWYQGESNRGDMGEDYFKLHKALVIGWRNVWGQGDFPFYYVQISALDCWRPDWHIPEVWAGQNRVMELPNTGMAVIHDLCEEIKNIHPKNKEGVGQRLALWALAKTYGFKDLPYAGPMYKSHEVQGARVRVHFHYAFGGLNSRDGKPLDWFFVAGEDRKFVKAQAEVDGSSVVVWSDAVEKPVALRFAWSEAAQPNLMNGAGLPASPFRTDSWPYEESK